MLNKARMKINCHVSRTSRNVANCIRTRAARARDHMASQIDLTYTGPPEEVPPSALL